jgi:hypothetical protein
MSGFLTYQASTVPSDFLVIHLELLIQTDFVTHERDLVGNKRRFLASDMVVLEGMTLIGRSVGCLLLVELIGYRQLL